MLNTGEYPNEERESHLSQILMENAPEKYYLSEKACKGILRRAEARGKDLPPILKQALQMQIEWLTPAKLEADVMGGGGKGALVQTEKSATLSTSQTQTLFQPMCGKSQVNITENVSPTLCTTHQGEPVIAQEKICYARQRSDEWKEAEKSGTILTSFHDAGGGGTEALIVSASNRDTLCV